MLEIHSKELKEPLLIEDGILPEVDGFKQWGSYPASLGKPYLRPVFLSPWYYFTVPTSEYTVYFTRATTDGYVIFKE